MSRQAADGDSSAFSWVSGALGAAAGAAMDIVTELTSFTDFRKRIDELIRDLKDSPASAHQMSTDQPTRAHFGGGHGAWGAADGLGSAHAKVISELEKLSKLLSDSIEGMSLAVLASHKGYTNVDQDVRDRLHAITTETTKSYGGKYVPDLPKSHGSGDSDGQTQGAQKPTAQSSGGETAGTI
ncbi:hypothetical protein [Streptomyces beihaiensis]|uniref:Uncharacterized protein n=1 Tax=Streptomyces beihaiensis TaxID=2984495 RepID=A0ABT3TNX3_9ACTN|nr:hypothetical protein [Streptomyces beihaiensis]MCX3058712.1 hypothetical protein [Streptomyces beihaiensis]